MNVINLVSFLETQHNLGLFEVSVFHIQFQKSLFLDSMKLLKQMGAILDRVKMDRYHITTY